ATKVKDFNEPLATYAEAHASMIPEIAKPEYVFHF
ncbi:hypothetical protein NPIL_613011, partial [Nephila pilipes]